ncbi:MAG TPA: hypothetical protein VGH76_03695 [Actinomycetospora sp.]|jgi:hypothetical protein|uniref:hypothetical protein n=1 Tax=Actinomycetospora sp. TaxID=1872135 RepID=UPI002F406E15
MLRLPVRAIILVVLLLGSEATSQIPGVMLAAAVAMVTAVALDARTPVKAAEGEEGGGDEGRGDEGGEDTGAARPAEQT